jgi:hypothetical protein
VGLQDRRLRGHRVQGQRPLRDALPLPHGRSPASSQRFRRCSGCGFKAGATGSFEFRAHALLKFGHQVDEALAAYQPARARLEEAVRRWQEAVAALPANGELDTTAANGLLTGALARGDTGRHEPRAERTGNPANAALEATGRHGPSPAS